MFQMQNCMRTLLAVSIIFCLFQVWKQKAFHEIGYLKQLFSVIKSLNATGLLIEYEDMFPFRKPIRQLSAKNAYTEREMREILSAAAANGLTVMPLIQTFGHMEYALKLKEFAHLREVPETPQSLCPSLNKSLALIDQILTQIVELHSLDDSENKENEHLWPELTHLHIGCDEVFKMGECSRCRSKSKDELFLAHIRHVVDIVQEKWPHLKVVIWDDMLRKMNTTDLQNSKLGNLIQPMIWSYQTNLEEELPESLWIKYASVFPTVWIASAFKGATGETAIVPPLRKHLENHLQWMALLNKYSIRFSNGIQGIALTGWQRFDHFATLCELLPVAIPSLALGLSVATFGYFESNMNRNTILSSLSCPEPADHLWLKLTTNEINTTDYISFSKCKFPGNNAMIFSLELHEIFSKTRDFLTKVYFADGWLSRYAVTYNFGSPNYLEKMIPKVEWLESALQKLSTNAPAALSQYYDKWTITELIEQKILPLITSLAKVKKDATQLLSQRYWNQRPFISAFTHKKDN